MPNELQVIRPGSKAESSVLNENFQYLNDLIIALDARVTSVQGTLETSISNTKSTLQQGIDSAASKANSAQTTANSALTKANNATKNAYITQVAGNSERGYIIYSNKYAEQWGITGNVTGGNNQTGTPSKQFADTTYHVQATALFVSGESNDDSVWVVSKATNKITFHLSNDGAGSAPTAKIMWRATGFIK